MPIIDTQEFPDPTPKFDILGGSADPDDEELPAVPNRRNFRLCCDESGIHGSRYMGFGALIMQHERRGDFTGWFEALRREHGMPLGEVKWTKTSARVVPFYEALIAGMFERNWLAFHCLVVERSYVDMRYHGQDFDMVKRKFFALFLQGRLKFLNAGAKDKAYHVIVDPLPSRYAKADEAAHKIVNNVLKRDIGSPLITKLVTRDSKTTAGIQLADLLLGATLSAWNQEVTSPSKLRVMRTLARYLDWPDMFSDTRPREMKFNIWHFQDPRDPRRIHTRNVKLLVPMRPYLERPKK